MRQARLADARLAADQQHLALARPRLVPDRIRFGEFWFTSDERCRGCWPRPLLKSDATRARLDLLVERSGFLGGFCAQFLGQNAAARFILRQRRAALFGQGQGAHDLPMGFLAPRIEFQLALGIAQRLSVFAAPIEMLGQVIQRIEHFTMQAFALDQRPLFKGFAAALHELREKIAAIQLDGLLQALRARAAGFEAAMGMLPTSGDQFGKGDDIDGALL